MTSRLTARWGARSYSVSATGFSGEWVRVLQSIPGLPSNDYGDRAGANSRLASDRVSTRARSLLIAVLIFMVPKVGTPVMLHTAIDRETITACVSLPG
jgi:hypothetical protein